MRQGTLAVLRPRHGAIDAARARVETFEMALARAEQDPA